MLAIARLLVTADSTDKPTADQAIAAAAATFTITTSYVTTTTLADPKRTAVACGQAFTPAKDPAGCDALDVAVPTGTDAEPMSLRVRSGNGAVVVALGGVIRTLDVAASRGAVDVTIPATKGAVIGIVAATGNDVVVHLPSAFAADLVTIDTAGAVDTTAFPDLASGAARGAVGSGAASITVRSVTTAGVSGRVTLLAQ